MADLTLADVRAKYPQYKNMSDQQLVEGLHKKFHPDMPMDQFAKKVGYSTGPRDLGPYGTPDVKPKVAAPTVDDRSIAKKYIVDPVIGVVEAPLSLLGYEPRTPEGKLLTRQVIDRPMVPYPQGGAKGYGLGFASPREISESVLPALGPAENALIQGPQNIGKGVTAATKGLGGMAEDISTLNQATGATKALGKVVPPSIKPSAIYQRVTGATKAAEAEQLAAGTSRELVQGALKGEEATIEQMNRINAKLQARMTSPVIPSLDEQGRLIKDVVSSALTPVRENIKSEAAKLYSAADQEATMLEKSGKFVDTKPVVSQINGLLERYKDEPVITGKLNSIKSMILGSESSSAPKLLPATGMRGAPAITQAEKAGRKYKNLRDAKEMLQELGYANPLEGYSRHLTKSARDIAGTLDTQIGKFSPEYAKATEGYKELLKPLDFMNSKFGKILEGTEGGFTGTAFDVTKSQDLPGKIFSKKENVEALVDALAGGRGATPESITQAQAQVNKLAEDYLRKSLTQSTTEAKLGALQAPQTEATLKAVPQVAEKLTSELTKRTSQEKLAKTLTLSAEEKAKAMASYKTKLSEADALVALPGDKSKTAALQSYNSLMKDMARKGLITPEQRDTAFQLIDNAQTLEAKSAEAQKLVKWVGGILGFTGVEEVVRRNIF